MTSSSVFTFHTPKANALLHRPYLDTHSVGLKVILLLKQKNPFTARGCFLHGYICLNGKPIKEELPSHLFLLLSFVISNSHYVFHLDVYES